MTNYFALCYNDSVNKLTRKELIMKRFEIGKVYSMCSPCMASCTWTYKVIKRTKKTIWLSPTDEDDIREENRSKVKMCRVSEELGEEWVKPLGSYSMCPMLHAGRIG